MIEDDFYATLKLKTGEELFTKVAPSDEDGRTLLLVSNPVIVSIVNSRGGIVGYKLEPWLKTTSEDLFIIDLEDVITISESNDIEMIKMYQSYVRQAGNNKGRYSKIDRKMGYISNVNDAKEILEKLFKKS
jgi:hypothetical protein